MTATTLEPDTELGPTRAMPYVVLVCAALTAWVGWHSVQAGWRPYWVYPPLILVLVAALLVLVAVTVVGKRQQRALGHVTVVLDRPYLTIGETATLSVQTGADAATGLAVDVHLEGREYIRTHVAKNTASKSGGGWSVKQRLVYRARLHTAAAAEGARVDALSLVTPTDIHPSVTDKPHGIDWTLRVRVRSGAKPGWDGRYPITIRGRNGSGISLNARVQEFQFAQLPNEPLPKLG